MKKGLLSLFFAGAVLAMPLYSAAAPFSAKSPAAGNAMMCSLFQSSAFFRSSALFANICPSDTSPQPQQPQQPQGCFCTMDYTPVCGADGKTYSNSCTARCSNVPVAHDGECTK